MRDRARHWLGLLLLALPVCSAWAQVTLEIEPQSATIGDPLALRLTIEAVSEAQPLREKLGPDLGPFSVVDERWSEERDDAGLRWVWSATVAAFETGDLEFPALSIPAQSGEGEGWSTEPRAIVIRSVLEESESAEGEPELADLKAPASVDPDLAPLGLAAILLSLFVALSALAWWLYRRYAARLAAAPGIEDPFARIPPHEWAFAALRELLDQRGASSADRFYAQLSWILKRYLGGRYRIDLLEHTTDEAPGLLDQAGAPGTAVARVRGVLQECDGVKFAKHRPSESERKDVVDRVYGIIDQTKPVEQTSATASGAA